MQNENPQSGDSHLAPEMHSSQNAILQKMHFTEPEKVANNIIFCKIQFTA